MRTRHLTFASGLLACACATQAAETVTYTYDALGRLVVAASLGTVNNGKTVAITHDATDNRTTQTTSGVVVAVPVVSTASTFSTENGGSLAFNVTLSGPTTASVTVNYATSNGTATTPADYTAQSGTLTFTPGQTSKFLFVPIIDDTLVEVNETVGFTLSAPSGATLGTAVATGTIGDNDVAGTSFAIADASAVVEGNALSFTVTRSGNVSGTNNVTYNSASGSATSGSDFTLTSGTLVFSANQTTATITVPTTDDTLIESAEDMTITLSGPTGGATIATPTGTGIINDNDTGPTTIAIGNASVTEGGSLVFTVTRSGDITASGNVTYNSASGSATSGSDFTLTSGTLLFAANQNTATISVPTTDDTAVESAETMTMTLSNASGGATITTPTGTGTINDNDIAPANISIANTSRIEGNPLLYTVTRTGNTSIVSTIEYASSDGTAIAPADYTSDSGQVLFNIGDTSKTITIPTTHDLVVEPDETVIITLSSPSANTVLTNTTATGTITNND